MDMVALFGSSFVVLSLAALGLWWAGRGRRDGCGGCAEAPRCPASREPSE